MCRAFSGVKPLKDFTRGWLLSRFAGATTETTEGIKMGGNQIIGIVLLGIGIVLLFFGYQSSQAMDDQITEAITGRFTDATMWFFIAGGVSALAGIGMLAFKK